MIQCYSCVSCKTHTGGTLHICAHAERTMDAKLTSGWAKCHHGLTYSASNEKDRLDMMHLLRSCLELGYDVVQCFAWVHQLINLLFADFIITTQVQFRALAINQVFLNLFFVVGQRLCSVREKSSNRFVVARGKVFCPITCHPVVRAAVVHFLHLPAWVLICHQEGANGLVEGFCQHLRLWIAGTEIFESA